MKNSILFLVLLQSLLTFGQAPQKMSYQSVVRNSANVLVANQAVGVRLSIVEGSVSGTAVYSETHTVTTNANGLFTLEAGGGTPTQGVFANIVWSNGAHYIKSEIDPSGGTNYTLTSTKKLLSVPYALNGITTAQADAISTQAAAITSMQAQIAAQAATIAAMQAQLSLFPTPTLGSLTTTSVGTITATTATTGATITFDGFTTITERGVVWSTASAPTIDLSTKTNDGSDFPSFTSTITGLTSATTYYVRAYITNSAGTSYGDELSFTTLAQAVSPIEVLPTATIGTQTWTTKNLNVTTYKNGDAIPEVQDAATWNRLTTGAWCHYANDPANDAIYGKLYNWYAVNDPRGLAPSGFHNPTYTEWQTLTDYLGGQQVAGEKLKSTSTLWQSTNNANNVSYFSALPGGYRSNGGDFYNKNEEFWISVNLDSSLPAYLNLRYNMSTINAPVWFGYWNHFTETAGVSVRCIKD